MSSEGTPGSGRPLIIGIGGSGVDIASRIPPDEELDILLLDTDRRSLERPEGYMTLLIGEQVVNGEGSGDNLNTAKACFKVSMEGIAEMILSRPVVITIASSDGATGIAGSVEIVNFLSRVGLPTFSILVKDPAHAVGGAGSASMADLLLGGPLRPGSLVEIVRDVMDRDMIASLVRSLCLGSRRNNDFPVPAAAWGYLREMSGPYEIAHHPDASRLGMSIFGPPGILVITMPKELSVEELRGMIDGFVITPEGIGIGAVLDEGSEKVSICSLQRSRDRSYSNPGPEPDPEALRSLIGSELETDMGPDKNIEPQTN